MGLRKEFQALGSRTLYVCLATAQHDLKVDTINVKQVTIFNDFVDNDFLSRCIR